MIVNKTERNYGIDLLRIISMIMITTHHVMLHGGIIEKANPFSLQYSIVWFIEVAGLCGVNIYGIVSGYVGYGHRHRPFRFLQLYFQVLFYTLTTTIVFAIFRTDMVTWETVRNAIFPFAYDMYWYYTAFFCLYFFMPFLDKMIDALSKSEAKKLIMVLFILFSVLQTTFRSQFALTNDGYSFLWLAVLYLAGAYIRKYNAGKHNHWGLIGYFLSVLFIWMAKIAVERINYIATQKYVPSVWLTYYISPFVVLSAVCLLLAFKEMRIGSGLKKLISFFAPVSFDVYLLQDEPLIRNTCILGAFVGYLSLQPILMAFATMGTAIAIWIIGSLIGQLRVQLFRHLRIDQFCRWLEGKIDNMSLRFLS